MLYCVLDICFIDIINDDFVNVVSFWFEMIVNLIFECWIVLIGCWSNDFFVVWVDFVVVVNDFVWEGRDYIFVGNYFIGCSFGGI